MTDNAQRTMCDVLREKADELWPEGMEPVPGVEYEATTKEVCDLMRQAADEIERLTKALEVLAEMRCGIPGHAVAVGCGSSVIAQKALEGELVRKCPDCRGRGYTNDWSDEDTVSSKPCETCGQKGLVPVE